MPFVDGGVPWQVAEFFNEIEITDDEADLKLLVEAERCTALMHALPLLWHMCFCPAATT